LEKFCLILEVKTALKDEGAELIGSEAIEVSGFLEFWSVCVVANLGSRGG